MEKEIRKESFEEGFGRHFEETTLEERKKYLDDIHG